MSEMLSEEIKQFLPHRYPFLLVDRVTECEVGKSLSAYKNVTANEPFFQGHFPNKAIMPGVLIIEALAQATGLLGFRTMSESPSEELLYMLAGVDNIRFKRQVIPGDRLVLDVELVKRSRMLWKFSCRASVDNELVTAAELMCAVTEKE